MLLWQLGPAEIVRALEFAAPAVCPLVIEAATKFIPVAFFFVPL